MRAANLEKTSQARHIYHPGLCIIISFTECRSIICVFGNRLGSARAAPLFLAAQRRPPRLLPHHRARKCPHAGRSRRALPGRAATTGVLPTPTCAPPNAHLQTRAPRARRPSCARLAGPRGPGARPDRRICSSLGAAGCEFAVVPGIPSSALGRRRRWPGAAAPLRLGGAVPASLSGLGRLGRRGPGPVGQPAGSEGPSPPSRAPGAAGLTFPSPGGGGGGGTAAQMRLADRSGPPVPPANYFIM